MAIPSHLKIHAIDDVRIKLKHGDFDGKGKYGKIDEYTKPKYGGVLGRGTIKKLIEETNLIRGIKK